MPLRVSPPTRNRKGVAVAVGTVTALLDAAGVPFELLPHMHTTTAASEAEALGIPSTDVAKTLIVQTPDGNVRAVLSALDRIDLHKLADLYDATRKDVELVSEQDLVREYPEFELGAVPPFGGAHHDRVVVDRHLAERNSVCLEAGSHDESIRLATGDLMRLTDAQVADISV
jgi:Ala-tRNA(Pro) deacylase